MSGADERDVGAGGLRHLVRNAPLAARDAYRRAAFAVTRTAGDNTALTLLAAGALLGAAAWVVRARGRRR